MAKEENILGVGFLGLGTPGDGVMGAVLEEYSDIEVNSVTLDGSSGNESTIPTEADDAYLSLTDTATPTTIKLRLYGLTAAERVKLMGGEVIATGDDTGKWGAPRAIPNIYLSLQLEGKEINGKKTVLKIPYGKVTAKDQGNITKNGLPAVEVVVTANTPESALGVKGNPYIIGSEAV